MRSHAPIRSTDKTVARPSTSVSVCKMCATHSHPVLVDKAIWKGAVTTSVVLATCFPSVHAIDLRTLAKYPQEFHLVPMLTLLARAIPNRVPTPTKGRADQQSYQKDHQLLAAGLCRDKSETRPGPYRMELRAHCGSLLGSTCVVAWVAWVVSSLGKFSQSCQIT